MEYPDNINDCNGDFKLLTEEQCKEVFEYNNGDIELAESLSLELDMLPVL